MDRRRSLPTSVAEGPAAWGRRLAVCAALGLAGTAFAAGQHDARETSTGPARIVSLTPSVTETLFALGAGGRVVAVCNHCDFPEEAGRLPRVGSFLLPVIERIVGLEPDLVLTSPSPGNRNAVEAIERAGVRVVVVSEGSASLGELEAAILATAAAVGEAAAGDELVAEIQTRLAAVRARVAKLARPRTAVVIGVEPLVLAGPASYLGELVEVAGGLQLSDSLAGKWPRVGWELLVASRPEVIIDLSASMSGTSEASMRRWQRFPDMPAVANRRVVMPRSDAPLRPGPRVVEAAEIIADAIHPEAAPDDR